MDKSGTDLAECSRKVASGRRVAGVIYGKRRRDLKAVQTDNLRGLLGIRRMDRVPNARISELCGVKKGIDESIDESVFRWLGNVERM